MHCLVTPPLSRSPQTTTSPSMMQEPPRRGDRSRDGRITVRPIIAVAGDQTYPGHSTPVEEPKAVVLDFVNSARPGKGVGARALGCGVRR